MPPLPSISPPNVSLESLSASSGGSETDSSSMGSSSDGESSVSSTDESLPPPPSMAFETAENQKGKTLGRFFRTQGLFVAVHLLGEGT